MGEVQFVSSRTRVLYAVIVVAAIASTAPGASALLYGWGLDDKIRLILVVIVTFALAQLTALRIGVAHQRGVASPCPDWLRAPVVTAALVGALVALMSAGVLSLFGPYDMLGLIIGGLATIAYLAWTVRRPWHRDRLT
jgi:hypothetical protein